MTDKTISSYQAGEYLQFQKDVVPEVTNAYAIGTRTQPFYSIHANRIPLTHIQQYDPANYTTTPYAPTLSFYDPSQNKLVTFKNTTQRSASPTFITF